MTGGLDAARSHMRRPHRPDERLAGVRAKIDRAIEHLEALHRETQAFRNSEAYAVTGKFESGRSSYVFRLHVLQRPPLRWGVMIGEIVHNLRSALDQLVWQLVKLNGRTPGKWNYFPIIGKRPQAGFAGIARGQGKRRGPLWGVSDEALACIERLQPYHGGNGRLLGVLERLWNADKHRFLVPTLTAITSAILLADRYVPNKDAGPVMEITVGRFADEHEAELVVTGLKPTGPDPKVEMKGEPPVDIAFSGGPGVVDALGEILYFVLTNVFAPLEDLFPEESVTLERGKGR